MTWFRVGGAGIPASLKNNMNSVLNKKFGTTGQNYPPNGWPDDVNLLGPLPEKTVAGAIAHTDDAADTVPVKSVICSIVPKQAGSGTPSPSNVRALSGYTGMTIYKYGKNFCLDGDVSVTGTYSPVTLSNPLPAGTYTLSAILTASYGSCDIRFRREDGTNIISVYLVASAPNRTSVTVTLTEPAYRIYLYSSRGTSGYTAEWEDIQIETGSTASSYEAPKTPETISDSWSSIGAILGGERNLSDGTLKSDMTKDTMTYSYLSGLSSDYIGYASSVSALNNHPCIWVRNWNYSLMPTFRSGGIKSAINSFPGVSINNSSIISTQFRVYIDVNGLNITSVQDFLDAVQTMEQNGDNLEITFELATPTSYSGLSTYDFETLYAVNNFYSDIEGGQTQVTYRQDIALALQAVSSSRGLMMASRPVTQLVGEESDPDQVNELVENDETEQEGEDNAR